MSPEPVLSPKSRRDSSSWIGILEAMEEELERSSARSLRQRMTSTDEVTADAHGAPEAQVDPMPTFGVFVPPTNPGPIPEELVERAQLILAAQREAIERVETARRTTGRHLAAMRSVPPHRGDRAVYLDTSA